MQQKLQQPHVHSNSPRGRALRRWFGRQPRAEAEAPSITVHELVLLTRRWPAYPLIAGQGRAAP